MSSQNRESNFDESFHNDLYQQRETQTKAKKQLCRSCGQKKVAEICQNCDQPACDHWYGNCCSCGNDYLIAMID